MYQPFLTEKANFLAEHHHLPEQERLRLWTRYNRGLDGQALVGQPRLPDGWLDTGSTLGRRLSVSGPRTYFPHNQRLTRSAPPSFCEPTPDDFDVFPVSPEAWGLVIGSRAQDDNSLPAYNFYNDTESGFPHFSVGTATPAIPLEGDLHSPLDTAMNGLEGTEYFGPPLQDSVNSPSLQPPPFSFTVDPPGHQEGLVDMPWSGASTSTSSCGFTLGSTLPSDMSHQDCDCSDAPDSGGTFPCFAPDFIVDESASLVTTSFQCPPSIYVGASTTNPMDGSPCFDSTHFDSPTENNPHGLFSPVFATSPAFASALLRPEPYVKCDSPTLKNDIPPVNDELSHQLQRREHSYGLRPLASKSSSMPVSVNTTIETNAEDMLDSSLGKRKLAISKSTYSRPKHPKKYCSQCDEYPDGFRGEHELRRHIDRAHMPVRKMFICVDKSQDGKFLDHCKKCKNKKKYGAYYNAAAHLRRTHFNRRQRGRGRGKTIEKRAGAGGGDYPSMEFLKPWILEVEDLNPNSEPSNTELSETSSDEDELSPANVLSTNDFEACNPFDRDESLYACTSQGINAARDPTSFAPPSEGDSYSFNINMPHVSTSQTNTRQKPKLKNKNKLASNFIPPQLSSCHNSLDSSFFPRLPRPHYS